jgi:hypothetical protein
MDIFCCFLATFSKLGEILFNFLVTLMFKICLILYRSPVIIQVSPLQTFFFITDKGAEHEMERLLNNIIIVYCFLLWADIFECLLDLSPVE